MTIFLYGLKFSKMQIRDWHPGWSRIQVLHVQSGYAARYGTVQHLIFDSVTEISKSVSRRRGRNPDTMPEQNNMKLILMRRWCPWSSCAL